MSRQEFPRRVKLAAFERSRGHCEFTHLGEERCGRKLQVGRFRYDHRIPDWMGGEPTLENCQVICEWCDAPKTAQDQTTIAKVRRIRERHAGIKRPRTITRWRNFRGQIITASRER